VTIRHRCIDERDCALVIARACDLAQPVVVDEVHGTAHGLGARREVACAAVAPRRREVDRFHRLRPLAQPRVDRVETEQGTRGGQVAVSQTTRRTLQDVLV
jgi:hypothetical protein